MKNEAIKETSVPWWDFTIPQFNPNVLNSIIQKPPEATKETFLTQYTAKRYSVSTVLFFIVIGGFIVNQLLLVKVNSNSVAQNTRPAPTVSPPPLSAFDQNIVVQLLNENKPPLVKGSTHDHADFKAYVHGTSLNFAKPEYYMKSAFIHVDTNQNQQDASGVLHMHAKNTPLWLFFRSLGMQLEKDSFKTTDGQIFKNENGNTLKFYLNGKKVDELGNYSFQPLDKLLISYGPKNDPDIDKQINSVTNFAKDHQK